MYVVPYLMARPDRPWSKVGIEITDSIYVALSMRIMTRMDEVAYRQLGRRRSISIAACIACWNVIRSAASLCISRRTTRFCRIKLWWQCVAGKKMFIIAHRIGGWERKEELDGRAHAGYLGVETPGGRRRLWRRRFRASAAKQISP